MPARLQTPGGNIAANLRSFSGLAILDGDGCDPRAVAALIRQAVERVRAARAPLLLRLTVPRLSGHSGQDTQAYKSAAARSARSAPATRCGGCSEFLVPAAMSAAEWAAARERGAQPRSRARSRAHSRARSPIRVS